MAMIVRLNGMAGGLQAFNEVRVDKVVAASAVS